MADFVNVAFGSTLTELETNFNTLFSTLLSNSVLGIRASGGDLQRTQGKELAVYTRFDDAGTVISNPYKIGVFGGKTASEAQTAAQAFITANPTFFFGDILPYYLVSETLTERYVTVLVYNEDATEGAANYRVGQGANGPAGGDLSGFYPGPTVVGIQGVSIPSAPVTGGGKLTYDVTSNTLLFINMLTFTSLAAAAAAQGATGQIVGQTITIFNDPAGPDDGTYIITAITGAVGDYTKISDATNTAAEISIVDAGGFYTSTDVEDALQEVGGGQAGNLQTAGIAAATVVDSVPFASFQSIFWSITVTRTDVANQRLSQLVMVTHDSTSAFPVFFGTSIVPAAAGNVAISSAISGANIELTVTPSVGTWTADIKRMHAVPV